MLHCLRQICRMQQLAPQVRLLPSLNSFGLWLLGLVSAHYVALSQADTPLDGLLRPVIMHAKLCAPLCRHPLTSRVHAPIPPANRTWGVVGVDEFFDSSAKTRGSRTAPGVVWGRLCPLLTQDLNLWGWLATLPQPPSDLLSSK